MAYFYKITGLGPGKRGHIFAHDVSWAAQTGKHLLRTQNVSEQHQKHFLCPGHKICVHNKRCTRGQTGKHLCRQQCVRNHVSSFARALSAYNRAEATKWLLLICNAKLKARKTFYNSAFVMFVAF